MRFPLSLDSTCELKSERRFCLTRGETRAACHGERGQESRGGDASAQGGPGPGGQSRLDPNASQPRLSLQQRGPPSRGSELGGRRGGERRLHVAPQTTHAASLNRILFRGSMGSEAEARNFKRRRSRVWGCIAPPHYPRCMHPMGPGMAGPAPVSTLRGPLISTLGEPCARKGPPTVWCSQPWPFCSEAQILLTVRFGAELRATLSPACHRGSPLS